MDMNLDDVAYSTAEYFDRQQQPIPHEVTGWTYDPAYSRMGTRQNQACLSVDGSAEYSAQQSTAWFASDAAYVQPRQRSSALTQSSVASHPRASSNGSVFSQWKARSSTSSTHFSWSNGFEPPYSQPSLETPMDFQLPIGPSYASSFVEEPASPAPSKARRKSAQRQITPEKDVFATCVSKTRRSRRSEGEPRYWCTSCEEPFIEKFDWKRHEATFQERRFVLRCNLCSAIYFLEKDFLLHHKTRHNCETCQRDEHVEAAKKSRRSRTGWGCGFCTHFSTDWKERCNHIAQHFEKDRKTMRDWRQSDVILSLLQRPAVRMEWYKILQSQRQLRADFGWNLHNTGRVEGYPENNASPHLQDLLEYYSPNDDAAALAQLAFDKIAFPSCPPPAPRKDYKDHHTTSLQSLMDDQASWAQLMSTIPEDDISPTDVCQLDFGLTNNLFGHDSKINY